MCMKSCAFVTTPKAWCVPRSLSLLTTNTELSTQIVGSSRSEPSASVTKAGSMFPVAIAWSAVAMRTAIVAFTVWRRIASCAARLSVMTSGSGPSSRIEPVSTNGTRCTTQACMMPSPTIPSSTARANERRPGHPHRVAAAVPLVDQDARHERVVDRLLARDLARHELELALRVGPEERLRVDVDPLTPVLGLADGD